MPRVKFRSNSSSCDLVSVDADYYVLKNLRSESRGQGHATELLTKVVEYADAHHLIIFLQVQSNDRPVRGALTNVQLRRFYEKFGWVLDPDNPYCMTRKPRKEVE